MAFLTSCDHIEKTHRAKRPVVCVLLVLMLLIFAIPPMPNYEKKLVRAADDLTSVLRQVNPPPETVAKTLTDENPDVKTIPLGPSGEVVYMQYRYRVEDTSDMHPSFTFYEGKIIGAFSSTWFYRRRGVAYDLIGRKCLKTLTGFLGAPPQKKRHRESDRSTLDEYDWPILCNDGSVRDIRLTIRHQIFPQSFMSIRNFFVFFVAGDEHLAISLATVDDPYNRRKKQEGTP